MNRQFESIRLSSAGQDPFDLDVEKAHERHLYEGYPDYHLTPTQSKAHTIPSPLRQTRSNVLDRMMSSGGGLLSGEDTPRLDC